MKHNTYSMHIIFADGSNPWVRFNMTREEYGFEINRWSRNYELKHVHETHGIHYFMATQKQGR